MSWPTADRHDEAALDAVRDAVENLSIQAMAVGDVSQSPFHLVETNEWTPQWEDRVVERAGALSVAAGNLERVRDAFCEATGIVLPDHSMARLEALGELAALLVDSYRQPTAYALGPDGPGQMEALEEAVVRLNGYAKAQGALSCAYEPFAWRVLDGEELGRRWAETHTKWWLKRFFAKRRIVKEMRANGARGKPDPSTDASTLASLRREGEAIDRLDQQLSGFKDWCGHETDPAIAESLRKLGEHARTVVGKVAHDPQTLLDIRGKVRTLIHDGNDLLAPDGSVGRTATVFLDALKKLRQTSDEFEAVAGASTREAFVSTDHVLSQMRETADTIQARHRELRDWCAWRRRRAEAIDVDLLPLVEAVEKGCVPPDEMDQTFEAAYCKWWSAAIIEEDEVLRTFSAPEHEAAIEKFRHIDDDFQKLTAEYIAAKLSGTLPDQDNVKRSSQWGVLRREIQKQRQHKPVRKLLEEAPDVLTSLTPCFMMSPLSVAQYLRTDQAMFDVIIFDEASQIPVWDAVGSIARGKQVIVAGDPRQMPPTNFFARTDDDPDGDIDTEGDLESILDEMLGASIPDRTLNLHYRSRYESLIAFSNDRYYGNELITFPAPAVSDRAVRLERPDAFYARGGARHNQGEAKMIVDEIVRRLTHRDSMVRDRSIGVVTFNSEQQTLIEDMLDDARRRHPEIEPAFSRERVTEPVFVKNLETVQGDERDVILFSVTYGPDRSGRVTMNFGPLNREGGERRLNVAVTRARSEMIVFSSLHPDQIDLSRTQARAVADLKHFLEYAEKGQTVLGPAVQGHATDFETPFEAAVARELRTKGWQVHPQVGVSAYRIDLGIVHPDAPGRYLAGVECDGAMYHSSAFARERDKIRQSVLENLGWTIFRVWSTDWWTNKEGAIKKIDDALRQRLDEDRREQAERVDVDASDEETGKSPDPDDFDVADPASDGSEGTEAHTDAGVGPDIFRLGTEMAVFHLERGVCTFPDFVSAMVDELNAISDGLAERLRPYFKTWYEGARHWPGAGYANEMSTQEEVDAEIASWNQKTGTPTEPDETDSSEWEVLEEPAPGGRHVISAPYQGFEGPTGPDPRGAIPARVAEGLCRIIQCEGPMLAKRAYDVYLRGCGIRRMGRGLKRMMDKALLHAIRQGFVIKEDEWGSADLVRSIVRSPDAPPVIVRARGPRVFDEIPPSELQLVARQLLVGRQGEFEFGSETHLKAVLGVFDLSRLTTPVGVKLLDVLKRQYSYVDETLGS